MAKQLMRNKETGEVVEFKSCMFNDNDCIVVYNDNQILRYNNVNEFRDKWEKTEEKKGEKYERPNRFFK